MRGWRILRQVIYSRAGLGLGVGGDRGVQGLDNCSDPSQSGALDGADLAAGSAQDDGIGRLLGEHPQDGQGSHDATDEDGSLVGGWLSAGVGHDAAHDHHAESEPIIWRDLERLNRGDVAHRVGLVSNDEAGVSDGDVSLLEENLFGHRRHD